MEEKKGIKINVYSLVSILTLCVMGIGASLAYFNASMAESKKDNISVSSINLKMDLKIIPRYTELLLLPTKDEDIEKAYNNKCLDYANNGACIAYDIEIDNIGQEQEGYLTFKYESDQIENLKFMVIDPDDNNKVLQPVTPAGKEDITVGEVIKLASKQNRRVTIVLWISELGKEQDSEQGGTFTGFVSFNSSVGARVTGTMNKTIMTG